MTILAAVVLALAAGVTEIFPVSGTGHLFILAKLLGVPVSGGEFQSFRAMLYFGVAFAGILFYRTQFYDMLRENLVLLGLARPLRHQRREPFGRRLGQLMLVALLPMLPALLFNGLRVKLEQGTHALAFISVLLCLSGVVLFFAARSARGRRTIYQATLPDALSTGLAQVLTICPGLSRSGFTAAILLARGFDGSAAAEFTGLLGIPVFLAAGIVQLIAANKAGSFAAAPYLILGFALSALTGFFALRLFTDWMGRRRPSSFAYWSWGAGILALILFLISA